MKNNLADYMNEKFLNNRRFFFIFFILAIEIYLFPLFFFGEKAEVQVFDNLDIAIPTLKMLVSSGMLFAPSDAIIPNMMGGLPRLVFGSEFNVYVWLHYFFEPFTAFVINEMLIHTVAFISMTILLNHYFIPRKHPYKVLVVYSIALMFAFLPFYTGAGLSVPSVPLVLYAFLNIRKKIASYHEWVIIILIPFYSSFVLVYFFFLLLMGGLFLWDTINQKNINWQFLAALGLMFLMYVLVEYRLFYDVFVQHLFISHRIEFASFQKNTLFETYRLAHVIFLNGSVDMESRASNVLLPFTLFALLLSVLKNRLNVYFSILVLGLFIGWQFFPEQTVLVIGNKYFMPILLISSIILFIYYPKNRFFYGVILFQIFISYWYAAWFYEGTAELAQTFSILKQFNFARIIMIQPVIWLIIVAGGMIIIFKKLHFAPLLIIAAIIFQLVLSWKAKEFSAPRSPLSYESYYAEDLFHQIKSYIGKDPSTYRVGCLAFEPAIAIYNGFYTIDGYVTSYPLEYKYQFFEIIKDALKENKENTELFVGWGSKCYLFDGGESFINYRRNEPIRKLQLNMRAFYDLNGRYLISSHWIASDQTKHLKFLHSFRDKKTFWTMYLYEVDLSKQ